MTEIIKAPNEFYPSEYTRIIFLAGSIEQDTAEKWQEDLSNYIKEIDNKDSLILNPRRDEWDASIEQRSRNEDFSNQVNWELDGIESANHIIFYFDKNTKSPITLLELGMVSQMEDISNIWVICPEGYWRKGNVEIMCERYDMELFHSMEEFKEFLKYEWED